MVFVYVKNVDLLMWFIYLYPNKYTEMESLIVQFKMVSIDTIMLWFSLGTRDGMKLENDESTDINFYIGFSKRIRNCKLVGSLNVIDWSWNFICQDWWSNLVMSFVKYYGYLLVSAVIVLYRHVNMLKFYSLIWVI